MIELTIPIVFSGLIAFVPNDYRHADFVTAYLVDTSQEVCVHQPVIKVEGCFDIVALSHNCIQAKNAILCGLGSGDIEIDPAPKERRQYLRAKPSKDMPVDLSDGRDLSWLLHLSNLGGGIRRSRGWQDGIKDLVSVRFRFGWSEARTCRLDENGTREVHNFEFCRLNERGVPECDEIFHRQAIAESIMFKVGVDAGPVELILKNRGDGNGETKKTILRLRCPGGYCPVIKIGNNMSGPGCAEHNLEYGFHFKPFYALVRDEEGAGTFIPHRIPRHVQEPVKESLVSNDCDLDDYRKALGQLCPIGDLPEPQVRNRVICPPVLLDP